ncbi:MAG: hypothetical protein HDT08_04150 [Bacteroidales bacterium]|nr:hypothetical protein [Bacteroidales bacterium]
MSTKRFKVVLEVEVDAPDNASTENMRDFLAFEFGISCGILKNNPCYGEGEYEVLTYDIDEL